MVVRLAVGAVARAGYDISLATDTARVARDLLVANHEVSGPTSTVVGTPDLPLDTRNVDAAVVLQATFTDATIALSLIGPPSVPILLWAFPEPRTGDRLRLNSLAGIELAAFELTRAGHDLRWLYLDPSHPAAAERVAHALGPKPPAPRPGPSVGPDPAAGAELAARLAGVRVGLIGEHLAGLTPGGATVDELISLGAPGLERVELDELFQRARHEPLADRRERVADLEGVDGLDAEAVERTLRLHGGLVTLAADHGWTAVATRCWPECFTDFGGAACAAQGMLADDGIPATCEADVFGAFTSLLLQWSAGRPGLIAELVDLDPDDGTVAIWRCGIAPRSMAHPGDRPQATTHPNRGLPLLHQFRLAPGRVTVARLSRTRHRPRLVLGGGEIVDRPRPYAGTSAVVRLDRLGPDVVGRVVAEGLGHTFGVVHGDVRPQLAGLAEHLDLEVVWL
jgi:L-fucose isomerase-like protein